MRQHSRIAAEADDDGRDCMQRDYNTIFVSRWLSKLLPKALTILTLLVSVGGFGFGVAEAYLKDVGTGFGSFLRTQATVS